MTTLLAAYLFVHAATTNQAANLPVSAPRLADGVTVVNLAAAPRATHESCGWYDLVDERPVAIGYYAVPTGYERTEDGYRRIYRLDPIPPTVRRYSKLKLIVAAKAAGRWADLKAFVKQADLEDEFLACQYFEDGNAQFVAGTNAVVKAGIATDAEVKTLLDASVDDGH